jgi:hypothetical protein
MKDNEQGSEPTVETPAEEQMPKPEAKVVAPIGIDPETKMLVAKDNAELMRMITIFMKGNSFPKSFDTPAKCITGWNLACALVPKAPQRAIARMMYINDTLGIWGELPKALAEETKELTDFELFVIDNEYNKICLENKNLAAEAYGAVCRIQRKNRTKNEYFFTMDDAQRAGLLNKKGPWTQGYARQMLCWRAQGAALKFEFADALMGTEIIEHRFNEFPEVKDVTPATDLADKINAEYSGKKK